MNLARIKSLLFVGRLLPVTVVLMALTARAHLPFESSTRVILHDATVEIGLTVGMDGGKTLLTGAPPEAFRIREVGPSFELPKEFSTRFYETSSGGAALSPLTPAARSSTAAMFRSAALPEIKTALAPGS